MTSPDLQARVDELERELMRIATYIEPHWHGAGLPLSADWMLEEIKGYREESEELYAQISRLRGEIGMNLITLNDFVLVYAQDFVDEKHLMEAHGRVKANGGTLAYLADRLARNRKVLKETE